jgi:hypothetical protein
MKTEPKPNSTASPVLQRAKIFAEVAERLCNIPPKEARIIIAALAAFFRPDSTPTK